VIPVAGLVEHQVEALHTVDVIVDLDRSECRVTTGEP
jgi:hypothetical protein